MADLLFACLTCIQASEKLTQQNPISPQPACAATADRDALGSANPTALEPDRCISKPEVMVSAISSSAVSRTESKQPTSPQKAVRLVSTALPSHLQPEAPARSVSPNWSNRSASNISTPLFLQGEVLQSGSQSQAVVQLQRQLQQLGYSVGPLDGLFGFQTQWAVVEFQRSHGLAVDGIAGPQTLAALNQQTLSQTATQPTPKKASPTDTMPSSEADKALENQDAIAAAESSPTAKPDTEAISASQEVGRSNFIAFAPSRSLSILGWIVLWVGGWRVIIGSALRDQPRYRMEPLSPEPLSPEPLSPEPLSPEPPKPSKAVVTVTTDPDALLDNSAPAISANSLDQTANAGLPIPGEEETVMIFAQGDQNNPYCYALLDDANGLFVMRGNELRLKLQQLVNADAIETTVTLLRTDNQGEAIEQSFSFQFQKAA